MRTDYKAPNCVYEEAKVINPLKGKTDKSWFFEQQVYDENGIARAIKSTDGSGNVPKVIINKTDSDMEEEFKTVVGNKQNNPFRGSIDGVSPTLTSAMGMGGGMIPMLTDASVDETKTDNFKKQERLQLPKELEGKKFRIRRLTPTECFRLMDVDDEDIDKIQSSGISNSAQYRCAGNSICVGVLYHLFRKLLIEPENESQQLSLF